MAAKPIPPDQIRKILSLSKEGLSNRDIAKKLDPPRDRGTVNRYIKFVRATGLDFDDIIAMGDEELDKVFHKGIPSYSDERMDVFFDLLDFFKWDTAEGISVNQMWMRYTSRCIGRGEDPYSLTQFRFHLANAGLVPKTDPKGAGPPGKAPVSAIVTTRSFGTSHIDCETGEPRTVHLVALYMVSSEFICIREVQSLDINEVLRAIYLLLCFLGGVPSRLETSDLLKACTKPKDLAPSLKSIMKDMHVFYNTGSLMASEAEKQAREHMERAFNHLKHMLATANARTEWDIHKKVGLFRVLYNRTQIETGVLSREEDFIRNERPNLLPVALGVYKAGEVSSHKVYWDGTIQVGKEKDTGYYSVPVAYIGQKVKCVHAGTQLLIMGDGGYITDHERVDNHRYSLKEEHVREWEASKYNDLQNIEYRAFNISPHISSWVSQFLKMAPEQGMHIQECIRKYESIERIAREDPGLMSAFCELRVQNNTYSYSGFIRDFYSYRDNYYKERALRNSFLNNI